MMDVTSLADANGADVAQVLTDALLDAPGWIGIGPDRERHRRLVMWHHHRMLYRKALRWGRRATRRGVRGGSSALRLYSTRMDGRCRSRSQRFLTSRRSRWLASRLRYAARGQGATMQRVQFHEPHLYFSQLSVDPSAQRSGVGRALMARVIADADGVALPVYAETGKPEVIAFLRSFGFVEIGREELPRGVPLSLMLRPPA